MKNCSGCSDLSYLRPYILSAEEEETKQISYKDINSILNRVSRYTRYSGMMLRRYRKLRELTFS